jgi:hypothetical protein
MVQKGRRRGFRSLLVEPFEQVKLGLLFLLVNTLFAVLMLGTFGWYVWDIYKAVSVYFQLSHQESELALAKFYLPVGIILGLVLLFVATTLYVSIRYTHEIYGPLVSIHRFLDDLLGGRKPPIITLRESDQLQDLAGKLNNIAERMVEDNRGGPMVAIHRFLDDLNSGRKPTPLALREGDHYRELAAKLNALSEKMDSKK